MAQKIENEDEITGPLMAFPHSLATQFDFPIFSLELLRHVQACMKSEIELKFDTSEILNYDFNRDMGDSTYDVARILFLSSFGGSRPIEGNGNEF